MCFRGNATLILNLLDDMDTLLQTDIHFLMGKWISDARAMGKVSTPHVVYLRLKHCLQNCEPILKKKTPKASEAF